MVIILNSNVSYTKESLEKTIKVLDGDDVLVVKDHNNNFIVLDNNAKEMLRSYYQGELIQKEMES